MSSNQSANSVIWVASYPKSGNTWVQTVVRRAGASYGFPDTDIDVYRMLAEKRKPKVIGGVRPGISGSRTTILKTHGRIRTGGGLHPELGLKTVAFVHVMRNPLDMLLSYINFTRLQYEKRAGDEDYQQKLFRELLGFDRVYTYQEWLHMTLDRIPRKNLDHALRKFTETGTEIPAMSGFTGGSWMAHCLSWLDAARNIPGVLLKYEDLLKSPEAFLPLQELFTFSNSQIEDAVSRVSQRQRNLKSTKIFYNKMESFYFVNYFSPAAIAGFCEKFKDDLARIGYGDLLDSRPAA